jgi:6-phosphogluconolactonase
LSSAQPALHKVALYANVGADLTHYDVDVAGAELIKRAMVTAPAGVQYAWPHVSRRYLYVATSSSASGYGAAGTEHHVTAFRIDPASGALTPHGAPIRLPTRPIHMTTDIPSRNILVAFNNPSAVRIYRINEDFTPGEEVKQPGPIDAGIFAHQVRVTPDNRLAILVTRGNEGTPTKAEDPGALKVFDYKDGVLTNEVSIAPSGGKEFGPRHLDFHPAKPPNVRVDRDAEQDVRAPDGGRQDQPGDRIPRGDTGRAEQHQGATGGRHGPCPSERPFLYGANRASHDRVSGQASIQRR